MAKHGPFKVKLGLRWAEVYDAHAVESTTMDSTESFTHMMSKKYMLSLRSLKDVLHLRETDLDCMAQLLQIVAHDVMDVDFRYWNQNVGRGISFYSGPMMFLKRFLGAIVDDGNTCAPCQPCDYQACRERLSAAHHAGIILNTMPIKRGLTLHTYSTFARKAMQDLSALHPLVSILMGSIASHGFCDPDCWLGLVRGP